MKNKLVAILCSFENRTTKVQSRVVSFFLFHVELCVNQKVSLTEVPPLNPWYSQGIHVLTLTCEECSSGVLPWINEISQKSITPLGGEGLVVPNSGVSVLSTSDESRGLSALHRRWSTSSANISCRLWPALDSLSIGSFCRGLFSSSTLNYTASMI